jgi:acetyl-CoA synthetase
MLRGIYGDPERFVQQYFSRWQDGVYFTGDGARRDEDGDYWLLGRVDDVLNVAGHRHRHHGGRERAGRSPAVAEAAVVGRPHEIKGQAIARS